MGKVPTADEVAEKEMNKLIGKAIAKRQMEIKKLQEDIRKLKSGEMTPEADDNSSAPKTIEKVREIIREEHHHHPRSGWQPYVYEKSESWPSPYNR